VPVSLPYLARAALYCIFSPARFAAFGANHIIAMNTDGTNLSFEQRFRDDAVYKAERVAEYEATAAADCRDLRRRVAVSLLLALAAMVAALAVGAGFGALAFGRPVDVAKVCNAVGTALASWATLFGLGTAKSVWGGTALIDQIAPLVFRVIFLPGASLLVLGAIL
jgi:hypothetical protein